jgi:hypothetical protein
MTRWLAAAVLADISNYTNVQPLIQINQALGD